tara:strand:+ start:93 stop:839 length:747 start_codon:yes stop_codon:yes gene_type:complete
MPLKIKPVNHGATKANKNRYCGPSVISAITGMTTGEAARLIRHVGGRKAIKGSTTWEIKRSLELCGIESKRTTFGLTLGRSKGVTLAGWLKGTVKERTADRVFLIVAGWHWQLVQGRRYVCGIVRDVVSIKDKKIKRRARVAEVYELTMTAAKVVIPPAAKKVKVIDHNAKIRRELKKLTKQYGFEVDYERDFNRYSVWMSEEAETLAQNLNHNLCDSHYCDDWAEIGWRIGEMVGFMKEHFPAKKVA